MGFSNVLQADPGSRGYASSMIGQAMFQGMQQRNQQEWQRGLMQKAFQDIQPVLDNPKASALENVLAVMKATAGIPGMERPLAALIPLMMRQKEFEVSKVAPPGGTPEKPSTSPQAISKENKVSGPPSTEGLVDNWIGNPKTFVPWNQLDPSSMPIGTYPNQYTPEEMQEAEQKAMALGYDPKIARDQMEHFNQASRQRYDDMLTYPKKQMELVNIGQEQQEKIRDQINILAKDYPESDKSILEDIVRNPDLIKESNLNVRVSRGKEILDRFKISQYRFKKEANRYGFGRDDYDRNIGGLRQDFKLLNMAGRRNEAEKALDEGGYGPVEKEMVLNPLPDDISKGISSLPKLERHDKYITAPLSSPQFEKQFEKAAEKAKPIIDKYKKFIEKNFVPDSLDYRGIVVPGTSLLLLRKKAMSNGMTFSDFDTMINDLISSGKIKIGSYQANQLPLIHQHPDRLMGIGEIFKRGFEPFGYIRKE